MSDQIKLSEAQLNEYLKTVESIPGKSGKAGELVANARNNLIGVKDFKTPSLTGPLHTDGTITVPSFPYPANVTSTHFEKLVCLGYNTNKKFLEAVVEIYQPYGYGGPCSNSLGSNEVVKFWADLSGDGDYLDAFEFLGQTQVHVFDPCSGQVEQCQCYKKLPINYAVNLRVSLASSVYEKYKLKCKCVTVKAQLMWNGFPYWGNTIERTIRFHD